MSLQSIDNPFSFFTNSAGGALDAGKIYIGVVGLNPETNPVEAYWNAELTIPAAQPIRTIVGYPSYSGSAGNLNIASNNYSITVRNKKDELIYSNLNANNDFLINDLSQAYIFDTVALMKTSAIAFLEGKTIKTNGYYSSSDGGQASYLVESAGIADNYGDHTLSNGTSARVQIDGIINLFQYGVNKSQTKTVNNAAFLAALARTDFDVMRVPFVLGLINVIGNLPITNGKRIVFDSEYMGEPLYADPDAGLMGDGTAPVFTTGTYPATANTHREITLERARIRNSNFPCLELLHSDDAKLNECAMLTSNAEALKIRFSARVKVSGGNYLTTFSTKEMETNFAITAYDNCNGLYIGPSTKIAGGANGGGVDVTQTQKIDINGIYEVCGGFGQRVGGFSGNPNALWTANTAYTRGQEVKNTTNGWVCTVSHTSSAAFSTDQATKWKVINGNCNGVKFSGYLEQVQRPFSIGAANYCLGVSQGETYSGNSALPANGVPLPDYCIQLGLVVGFGYTGGISYHKEGTEPTFDFIQAVSGGSLGDFLQDGTLDGHHVQGGGADFANNLNSSDNIGQIFGRNKIKLVRGGVTSGDRQVYISDKISANVGTGNDAFIFDTGNGGVIDSITIIEKAGVITSSVRVGYTSNTADNLNVNPETLAFTSNAAITSLTSGLIRPNTQQIIRIVAGAGTGTFRVMINYRM